MINSVSNESAHAAELCLRREFIGITRRGCRSEKMGADRARWNAARRIEPSLRHLLLHLNQPMKVPALSAMAGLSQSSFFALFKSATGRTPLEFFIHARMQRARQLLNGTMLPIKEIAARLGYEDPFYFSRLFKSVVGLVLVMTFNRLAKKFGEEGVY